MNIPTGPSDPCSIFMYHDGMVNESWIDFKFILMHKGILVIM